MAAGDLFAGSAASPDHLYLSLFWTIFLIRTFEAMEREQKAVIERTADFVRDKLEGEASGHDWWHVERVRVLAGRIGREEGADAFVVELAALLHDVADWKLHGGDTAAGTRVADEFLREIGVGASTREHVCSIIGDLSFKGAGVPTPMATLEGQVVQDADRLDALGAIGIARAFAYGGHAGREIFNPEIQPQSHDDFESYRRSNSPTINHFHEKLLLVKDRLHTTTARRLAASRHSYMKSYLDRFHQEWEGEA